MFKIGIKNKIEHLVKEDESAISMGSGDLEVYATPAMIALMEKTCMLSIEEYMPEGMTSVGISIEIDHVKASGIGAKIKCISEITAVDGKKISFRVCASDNDREIGKGKHVRYIVNSESFMNKL